MKEAIIRALGYMTAAEAISNGLTHHASYYGIPLWWGPGFTITAKWAPLDYLIPVFANIELFIRSVTFPEDEPVFQFKVGKEIWK